jgi:hypothetical protein
MKYNDTLELLKFFAKAVLLPESISNNSRKSDISNYSNDLDLNNSMNNNVYSELENSNIEFSKSIPTEDNKPYNNNTNKSNNHYTKQQDTSSNPQGVIDSIAQDLTSARLQQAIILSEIVGKPKSKTRQKRRF